MKKETIGSWIVSNVDHAYGFIVKGVAEDVAIHITLDVRDTEYGNKVVSVRLVVVHLFK